MSAPDSFRLAVAQPAIDPAASEEARVEGAVAMIAEAGEGKARPCWAHPVAGSTGWPPTGS